MKAASDLPLGALTKHIVERHHGYARDELDRLDELSRQVLAAHGGEWPELERLRELLEAVGAELRPHMAKEEVVLFPYIQELETARRAGRARPFAPFGSVDAPIRVMMHDHERLRDLLKQMRALTGEYLPPANASSSWKALYAGLEALERDLLEHVDLESNELFPRVLELEH